MLAHFANLPAIINTAGLVFDIVGAWLVAFEIVSQFRGPKLHPAVGFPLGSLVISGIPHETKEYSAWEKRKFRLMWAGPGCLTIGFVAQIVATWIPLWMM